MASFDSFKSEFHGDIVTVDQPDYEKAIARWSMCAVKKARIVSFVKDEEDVALAIKYAVAQSLPLAIRGGGHNVSGASSVEDGLVIDLSRYINMVRVDPGKKLAYVGGGAVWGTVEKAAIMHGLATVGGNVNHTGVGGLPLGGGWGYLSASYGLAIDNLEQARLVLADGRTVIANATENEDLFWGIRGGGSNFGVCTEFVFRLHEQRRTVYAGKLIFPEPLIEAALKAAEAWMASGPSGKASMMMAMARSPTPPRAPVILCVVFYNGTEEEGRTEFKDFLALNPVDMTGEKPYEVVNTLNNEGNDFGQYVYQKPVSQKKFNAAACLAALRSLVKHTESGLRAAIGCGLNNTDILSSVPRTATAYTHRGPQTDMLVLCFWDEDKPEQKEEARRVAGLLVEELVQNEEKPEDAVECIYGNLTCEENIAPDAARMFFGENYPRLQQLKKKYDPQMLFSRWYPIIPEN